MKKSSLERLKELDSQAVKFHDANQILLQEGYSEAEILDGLYRFNYDGVPDDPKAHNKIQTYYEKHPDEAHEIAKEIVKAMHADQKYAAAGRMAASYTASHVAPGHHAKSHYAQRFSSEAGIPYFSTLVVVVLTAIAWLKFDLPSTVLYIVPGVYVIGFVLVNWLRDRM